MKGGVIAAERELRESLRESMEESLGRKASREEVEAQTEEAYWGEDPAEEYQETAADREERERRREATIRTIQRWRL